MSEKEIIYHLVSLIPKGKVLTYGQIAKFLEIKFSRLVGQVLHQNKDPKNIPCHRVVFGDGGLALSYSFGGIKKQEKQLEKEGVKFYHLSEGNNDRKVDLKNSQWQPTKVLKFYFILLKKFGNPGPWPWFNKGNQHTKEEIVIGAILTQNTSWSNVEKALNNLRKNKINSLKAIYLLAKKNLNQLKKLIRPSGFYNQKAERLFSFCEFIINNYKNLENFFKLSLKKAREKLLSIKGIGEETADNILLYAGEKPIFVIDAYTIKFVKKYLNRELSLFEEIKKIQYQTLQRFFMDNLPCNIKLFQDYHALIVRWGKEN